MDKIQSAKNILFKSQNELKIIINDYPSVGYEPIKRNLARWKDITRQRLLSYLTKDEISIFDIIAERICSTRISNVRDFGFEVDQYFKELDEMLNNSEHHTDVDYYSPKLKIFISYTWADEEIVLAEFQYIQPTLEIQNERTIIIPNDEAQLVSKKPKILVIDDNRELLDFITETLIDTYCVTTAADGAQGIEKAVATSFDLIISDVMMPYIDGFELTRKLKSDMHTSHIPIILLTAKTGDESKWEGLQTGADYYVEKPFLPHILIQLIENVLKTRENLYNRFRSDLSLLPKDVAFLESDRELIDKITKLVEKNIDLPNLDVQFIIDEVCISRSLLHLKLKKLTGCSATEFVRSIRLRAAAKLIADGKCNISEAAYQTGFSTPAYFSHRFKEYFGKSPKEYFDV